MFDKRLTLFCLLLLKHCFISSSQNTVLSTGKDARQSTTYSFGGISYDAALAVDDDTSSDFDSGSCSRTAASTGAIFWYVDLGDTYSIDYVNVYPASLGTLTGLEVRVVSDTSTILTSTNICGSIPSSTTDGYYFVDCNPAIIGRYVSLYKSNINEIIVCEVDVYGVPVPDLTCPSDIMTSTPSTTTVVTWDAPTIPDNPSLVIACNPQSGWSFHVGTTAVTCSATNYGDCTFTISVTGIGACASSPCLNGGACNNFGTFYTCTCPTLYTGTRCETGISPCASSPCVNGGTCLLSGTSYTCTCPSPYTGTRCETGIGACASSPCLNGGACNDFGTFYTCTCPTLYTGTRCETGISPCGSSPCVNGGTCLLSGTSYTCTCPSPYTGTRCETGISPCASSPCVNGGTCIDVGTSYTCTCPSLYSGTRCETGISPCASSPCINDGTCIDVGISYTCTCPSLYSGTRCETANNPCDSSPCVNGGTCNNGGTSYTCTCTNPYTGTICETDGTPIVSCPNDITMDTNTGQTEVTWDDLSISGNVDSGLSATCTPSSGSSFNAGSTVVTCNTMDTDGNTGECTFTVNVNETTSDPGNLDDTENTDGSSSVMIIVIVLVGVLFLLIVTVVLVWKVRSKRQNLKSPGVIPMSAPNGLRSGKEPEQTNNELLALGATNNQEDYSNYTPDPDPYVIQDFIQPAIPIHKLAEYIEEKKANEQLTQEWESLPEGIKTDARKSVGLESNNATKNRYRNVIPYDEHRVVLDVINDNPYSDYINACFIKGFVKENEYIAAQGPNKSTVVDFWRMIWQENVSVIIMTANLVEDGKNKCTQYWPENVNKYGELNVSFLKEASKTSYLTRKLKVVKGTEVRFVKQYHFFVWPDKNIPRSSSPVINMLNVIHNETPSNAGPILVHCSAGAGRTGAIIAIDAMMKMATETGEINILEFVKDMRERRPNMVQTPLQYLFVYNTILEFVLFGDTSRAATDFKEHYQKLRAINPKSKKSYIADEFEALQGLSSILGGHKITGGFRPENRDKNRYPDLVPFDRNRPFIMTPGEDGPSDYINASFFDSFDKKDMFIGTQTPMENTIEDFWRMVVDYNSRAIVVLTDMVNRDRTVAEFWPDLNLQFSFKYLTVSSLTSEKLSRHINIHSFDITKNDEKKSLEVKIFEFLGWPANSFTPKSTADFLQLVTVVNNWQSEIEDPTMVVMCLDGLGRTGVFCATMSSLRRLLEEQTVDILQSVKLLRNNRLGMVQTLSQYEFIYKTILEHLLAFEVYDNVPQEEALYANV